MSLTCETIQFLEQRVGLPFRDRRFLLAVSGGMDSMLLLETWAEIFPRSQWVVAHFNHGARPTANRDQQLVERRGHELGIEVRTGCFPASAVASGIPKNEVGLRQARREFLLQTQQSVQAEFIVTAHHADDQLETLLMRLLRGTGLDGIGGIRAIAPPWLRPFLFLSRKRLAREAVARALAFHEDETNATEAFLRNRIRHRLVPAFHQLSREFGGPDRVLGRMVAGLEDLSWAADELEHQTNRLFSNLITATPFWLRASSVGLSHCEPPWQTRLLRRIFRELGADVPDRAALNTLMQAIASGLSGFALPGVQLTQSCGYLYFQNSAQRSRYAQPPSFSLGTEGWQCDTLGMSISGIEQAFPGALVRFFEPGDRYGSKKLKERLLKLRIPRPERRFIPVITVPGSRDVLWHYPENCPPLRLQGPAFPLFVAAR